MNSLRIMTFNVRNGRGMDEKVDYGRTADLIKREYPDVVGIQELDSATKRSNGAYVLEEIAKASGYKYAYSAAIDFDGGKYGVGMLFKEAPIATKKISLPGREEKRVLQILEFKNFIVFNTHFSLTAEDRAASVVVINNEKKHFKKPIFLLGDLNAVPADPPIRELLSNQWSLISGANPSFPATIPDKCIDYIFLANKKTKNVVAKVIDDPITSDHRAVVVAMKKF